MKNSKIGRNDPCPCGSGKKYKTCCLGLEGLVDRNEKPFMRYSQLISTIKVKLDQQYKSQIKKMRKSLQERFLRLSTTNYLPQEQESILSDWLWFDMTDSEGMTFGSEYLAQNGAYIEEPLRNCLQSLNSSYLSLYQPIGMNGDSLLVKDFITGEDSLIMLKEPLDAEISEDKPLLLGRLVALPLGNVFSGMVLMMKNEDGQGEYISQHINYLRELKNEEDITVSLKNYGEILFGLYDRANRKALLPLNDIRVLFTEEDSPDLITTLEDSEVFSLVHETDGIRWYDLQNSSGNARLGIHSSYLVSYADIVGDVIRMKNWLSNLIPQRNWQIVNSLLLFQQPAPELDHIWYTVIKDQETERWLHTPHRELDNKTPLEILEDEHGQERIYVMLDSFASQASGNEYSEDLINYMRSRIK